MDNGRRWLNLTLFGLAALTLALTAGTLYMARGAALNYVHPPRYERPASETPGRYGIPYQDLALITPDGLQLAAWYTRPQEGNDAAILVAHGHAGARSAHIHALFARHGFGVLSWDFRAHGESEGDFTSFGYHEARDVETALDYALAQPEVEHVGAWGGSMGGAAVILAAARRPEIEAVVADSAFPTLEDELELNVHSVLFRPLVQFFAQWEAGLKIDQVRPVDQIGNISPRPVFIIQGAADSMIPADAGERLCGAAGENCTLWLESGAGHMGVLGRRPAEYERRVIAFIEDAFDG